MKIYLFTAAAVVASLGLQYLFALAGEPRSTWLFCQILEAC